MELIFYGLLCILNSFIYYSLINKDNLEKLSIKSKTKRIYPFVLIFSVVITLSSIALSTPYLSILSVILGSYYIYQESKKEIPLLENISIFAVINIILFLTYSLCAFIISAFFMATENNYFIYNHYIRNIFILILYTLMCIIMILSNSIKIDSIKKIASYKLGQAIIIPIWLGTILGHYYIINKPNTSYAEEVTLFIILVVLLYLIKYIANYLSNKEKFMEDGELKRFPRALLKANTFEKVFETYHKGCSDISNYLMVMGISSGLIGHKQLVLTIVFIIYRNFSEFDIKNDIYPEVMRCTGAKSVANVDKNIRTAIERAWDNASLELLEKEYPYPITAQKGAPTNKEFIMFLVEKFKYIKKD